jgi:hypothetical protein
MTFHAERIRDDRHVCQLLESPGGQRLLILTFEAGMGDMPLKPSPFAFSLSNTGRTGVSWDETPQTAVIQISIGDRIFFGLHGLDPAFRLQVNVSPGGADGTFSATHLRDVANGQTVDVTGSWRCSPQQQDKPAQVVATVTDLMPGPPRPDQTRPDQTRPDPPQPKAEVTAAANTAAIPADSKPTPEARLAGRRQFQIFHKDRCRGAACAKWTATDVETGKTLAAPVVVKGLKISRTVRRQARDADVALVVSGTQKRDAAGNPIIIVKNLERVTPRSSVD